jgi:PTH2 family peptidyl-tRNA hydrolase
LNLSFPGVVAVLIAVLAIYMCSKYFKVIRASALSVGSKLAFSGKNLKQVYLVRTDLDMGKGKIAAQCSHAAVKAFRQLQNLSEQASKALDQWEWQGSRKVVVKVGSEDELTRIISHARRNGIYATTIRDAGRTQVEAGALTVGVIGPADEKLIDEVSGHLKLL